MIASFVAAVCLAPSAEVPQRILERGLTDLGAHRLLTELTTKIGGRLSGSPEAERAVKWCEAKMRQMGLQNVRLVHCMVPHWVRGKPEVATLDGKPLSVNALGGSVATPKGGIEAEVVEVHSLKEAEQLGAKGKGKIVFFNRGFDPKLPHTFAAYGGAVDQRVGGATAAAKSGAVAVLVRSMTLATDDAPHTGAMGYGEGKKIPAAALGIQSANRLSAALKKNPHAKVRLKMSCQTLPDVPSANVCGEIVGSELPDEVIVMGGHLDSWDTGKGAHDDGAGCMQALEALRLMRVLGLKPKRTIRAVMFMNEENGLRGAPAYAEFAKKSGQTPFAAIESDSGGFMPRSFGVSKAKIDAVRPWEETLRVFGIERFNEGGGDADIGPLEPLGATLFALEPENARYFDYHHSRNDTIDKVNPREVEFGAMAMATLAWLVSENGL
ncbi:MAG: M20/M25/M40 family metallo-hydrolase [Fimbriimonadales bacterium]